MRAGLLGSLVTALLLVPGATLADESERGLYVRGSTGYFSPGDIKAHSNGGVAVRGEVEQEASWSAAGALGYQLHRAFRVELEGAYHKNSIESLDAPAAGGALRENGSIVSRTLLFNGIVDLAWGELHPYLGGGIGWVFTHDDNVVTSGFQTDWNDRALAYQLIVGFTHPLGPALSVDLDYRWLRYADTAMVHAFSGKSNLSYDAHHSVMLGLRYKFGRD